MTPKAFRPGTSREGERAGTDNFAWQQISAQNTNSSPSQQQNSIIRYSVDGGLNVIRVEFEQRLGEVPS